jgi:GNAT superfamily N-acetyltransferase
MPYSASVHISIRLDNPADPEPDRAIIDRLLAIIEEQTSAEKLRAQELPRASDFPTSRFLLAQDEAGEYVAMSGSVLPGAGARYGFEKTVGFPHPALPTSSRTQLGEGLGLYVDPAWRRFGLARALTFLSMLLAWDAGAAYIVAENGAVSLSMALAAGFTNTGIVTNPGAEVPYYLTAGRAEEVLDKAWRTCREPVEACTLSPAVRAVVERWAASRPPRS